MGLGAGWGVPVIDLKRTRRVHKGAGWGVPVLCTRVVHLVCTLAFFVSGGGQKVSTSESWGVPDLYS